MSLKIQADTSVNTVLEKGTATQKIVAKMFDANSDGEYDTQEAALFNNSEIKVEGDTISIKFNSNTITLNGDYSSYKIKNTGNKSNWDYSVLNTDSQSVVAFDNQNKENSTIRLEYDKNNKRENVAMENYGSSNGFFNTTDGAYVFAGENNEYSFNGKNSKVNTVNTTSSNIADVILNNSMGDGYGLSDGEIIQRTNHYNSVNNSAKITVSFNNDENYQNTIKTSNQNIFFGRKFLDAMASNFEKKK